jgi:hypothetical protein
MATIKTTPIFAASTVPALEVTTVTEVITRLAAWLRRLPPPQERIDRLLAELEERFAGRTERITEDACADRAGRLAILAAPAAAIRSGWRRRT